MSVPPGVFVKTNCCNCTTRRKVCHIDRYGTTVNLPSGDFRTGTEDVSSVQTAGDGSPRVFGHYDYLSTCSPSADPTKDGVAHYWVNYTKYEGVTTTGSDGEGGDDPHGVAAVLDSDVFTLDDTAGVVTCKWVLTFDSGAFVRTVTITFSAERLLSDCLGELFSLVTDSNSILPAYPATPFEHDPWGVGIKDTGAIVISPDPQADNYFFGGFGGDPRYVHGVFGYAYLDTRPGSMIDMIVFYQGRLSQNWTIPHITWYVKKDTVDITGHVLTTVLSGTFATGEVFSFVVTGLNRWWATDTP